MKRQSCGGIGGGVGVYQQTDRRHSSPSQIFVKRAKKEEEMGNGQSSSIKKNSTRFEKQEKDSVGTTSRKSACLPQRFPIPVQKWEYKDVVLALMQNKMENLRRHVRGGDPVSVEHHNNMSIGTNSVSEEEVKRSNEEYGFLFRLLFSDGHHHYAKDDSSSPTSSSGGGVTDLEGDLWSVCSKLIQVQDKIPTTGPYWTPFLKSVCEGLEEGLRNKETRKSAGGFVLITQERDCRRIFVLSDDATPDSDSDDDESTTDEEEDEWDRILQKEPSMELLVEENNGGSLPPPFSKTEFKRSMKWYIKHSLSGILSEIFEEPRPDMPFLVECLLDLPLNHNDETWKYSAEQVFIATFVDDSVPVDQKLLFWGELNKTKKTSKLGNKLISVLTSWLEDVFLGIKHIGLKETEGGDSSSPSSAIIPFISRAVTIGKFVRAMLKPKFLDISHVLNMLLRCSFRTDLEGIVLLIICTHLWMDELEMNILKGFELVYHRLSSRNQYLILQIYRNIAFIVNDKPLARKFPTSIIIFGEALVVAKLKRMHWTWRNTTGLPIVDLTWCCSTQWAYEDSQGSRLYKRKTFPVENLTDDLQVMDFYNWIIYNYYYTPSANTDSSSGTRNDNFIPIFGTEEARTSV